MDQTILSELEAVRLMELEQARRTRASCGRCGHSWTPRNPNPTVNRCPACGVRGKNSYITLSTEVPADAIGS